MSTSKLGSVFLSFLCAASAQHANAATLNASCAGIIPGINVSLPSPLPDIEMPGLTDICRDEHMDLIEAVVNAHHDQIEAQQGHININSTNINSLFFTTSSQGGRIGTLEFRVNNIAPRVLELEATVLNHGNRITTLEGTVADHGSRITDNEADIAALFSGVGDLRQDMNEGLAMVNAMEVFLPDPGANFRLNVGLGHFGGATAFGVTGAGRLDDSGTAAYFGLSSVAGSGHYGGKAGVSFQW